MLTLRNIRMPLQRMIIDMNVEHLDGGITGIFGPSGSGKTTVLEIVTGIRRPVSAYIELDGVVLNDTSRRIHVPIEQRAIGYVPQDLALFPHLSVRENVLFGASEQVKKEKLLHIVELLEIEQLLPRGISNLSGGEKQRVAFARAVLASPRLLLLDEPLGSLDRALKEKMIHYLLHLRDELNIPMLYVSHESDELLQLCDEVLVLEDGHVVARGVPSKVL